MNTPTGEIERLKQGVLANIRKLCRVVHPKGYEAPQGGYWFVPGKKIKISYKTGGQFDLEDPKKETRVQKGILQMVGCT